MVLLDGSRLARERQPMLASRARAILQSRGRPPALLILAFGSDGHAPHVNRKLAAAAATGVRVIPLILPTTLTTNEALDSLEHAIEHSAPDAVFLQFPFPPQISEEALSRAIPLELDVDTMHPASVSAYFEHRDALPPVTVSAGLLLVDAYRVNIAARQGVVVAESSPFAAMFREAFARRGAEMAALVPPQSTDLHDRVRCAELVVVAAGVPRLIRSAEFAPDSVVIDVGYFNPDGRGDVETDSGIEQLAAIAPVPGGIGPMTVSALLERTIDFASRDL